MHNTFCSEGIYECYSYALGVQPDVKMTIVEEVE